MAIELVVCTHCGFKFRIDVEAEINEGNITVTRGFFYFWKQKIRPLKTIDLTCPNCRKIFEHKVES